MELLKPLLGRTLILVAHPDDEAVGCGVLLQRMTEPIVVFATDGAPRSEFFWKTYGSRDRYIRTRAAEAQRALNTVGVRHYYSLGKIAGIADQELHANLRRAYIATSEIIEAVRAEAILTLSYEGGHPDHDACCFLASRLGSQYQLPVWEMPLYHRRGDDMRRQRFPGSAECVTLTPSEDELARKQTMFTAYASQANVLKDFDSQLERFRIVPEYDFSRPPHSGQLNYEAWQWPMKGADLCRAFAEFGPATPVRKRECTTAA